MAQKRKQDFSSSATPPLKDNTIKSMTPNGSKRLCNAISWSFLAISFAQAITRVRVWSFLSIVYHWLWVHEIPFRITLRVHNIGHNLSLRVQCRFLSRTKCWPAWNWWQSFSTWSFSRWPVAEVRFWNKPTSKKQRWICRFAHVLSTNDYFSRQWSNVFNKSTALLT